LPTPGTRIQSLSSGRGSDNLVSSYGCAYMRNIRLILAYDGSDLNGWQRQPNGSTIQAMLEDAIHQLTGSPATLFGSGRTDAGVHASHQVANFHTSSLIPCMNLAKVLNNLLPPTVRVLSANEVATSFHARYAVRQKTYWYRIMTSPVCSPLVCRFVHHYPYPLNRRRMAKAAALLVGEHDFTSFAAADNPADEEQKSNVRVIIRSRLVWRPRASTLIYQVTGTGFLRYMVRNIVGTLIEVGRGRFVPDDITRILLAQDRALAGPTAPPQGLCLKNVEY
jgi:tRNA pseudouridine38-40 synthase